MKTFMGYRRPDGKVGVRNYIAILSTVCCCLPFGVVSIVYASKVDGLYRAGLYDEAQRASDEAKKWAIISAVVGFAASTLYCIVMFGFGMLGALAG